MHCAKGNWGGFCLSKACLKYIEDFISPLWWGGVPFAAALTGPLMHAASVGKHSGRKTTPPRGCWHLSWLNAWADGRRCQIFNCECFVWYGCMSACVRYSQHSSLTPYLSKRILFCIHEERYLIAGCVWVLQQSMKPDPATLPGLCFILFFSILWFTTIGNGGSDELNLDMCDCHRLTAWLL